jgi:hypothetical protein
MAFALAVEAAQLFGEAGKVMMTCTFIVILITVLINGGSTAYLLDWCGLAQGPRAQQVDATHGTLSEGNQQQQHWREPGQHLQQLQQQPDGESECEQVQLLLHEKLRGTLQEQSRMPAARQPGAVATGQPDDHKTAASRDAAAQQPSKQHLQQQSSTSCSSRPVLVLDALAKGMSEEGAGAYGMMSLDDVAGTVAAAACAARVASPALLLDDGHSAVAQQHGHVRRRSSGNGSTAVAPTGGENPAEHCRLVTNTLLCVALPKKTGACKRNNEHVCIYAQTPTCYLLRYRVPAWFDSPVRETLPQLVWLHNMRMHTAHPLLMIA